MTRKYNVAGFGWIHLSIFPPNALVLTNNVNIVTFDDLGIHTNVRQDQPIAGCWFLFLWCCGLIASRLTRLLRSLGVWRCIDFWLSKKKTEMGQIGEDEY